MDGRKKVSLAGSAGPFCPKRKWRDRKTEREARGCLGRINNMLSLIHSSKETGLETDLKGRRKGNWILGVELEGRGRERRGITHCFDAHL